jgi:hypothetical protein
VNGTVCLSGVAGLVTGCLDLMNTCRCAYDWFVRLCSGMLRFFSFCVCGRSFVLVRLSVLWGVTSVSLLLRCVDRV